MNKTEATEMSSSAAQVYMQIQSDWSRDEEESCWLDVYERTVQISSATDQELAQDARSTAVVHTRPSVQYQVPLTASQSVDTQHLVQINAKEDSWIDIQAMMATSEGSEKQIRTVFQAPNESIDVPTVDSTEMPGAPSTPLLQLYAVDVSKDERYVVVGGSDGVCMLWDSQNRGQMLPLKGHVADVTSARFFPSSQVVLTGSLDLTLRVWSVNGRCAAVLKGHLSGIEDVAIVGKGRNVLSCGTDGLIQLWNCGTQDVVAKWANDDQSSVHCLSLLDDTAQLLVEGDCPSYSDSNETETDGKVVFAGLDNGETLGVDIRARGAVLNVEGFGGAIISCACTTADSSSPKLFTGTHHSMCCRGVHRRFTASLCQYPHVKTQSLLEVSGPLMVTALAAIGVILVGRPAFAQSLQARNTMLFVVWHLPVKLDAFLLPVVTVVCVNTSHILLE
ncbi:hypothetical protein JM18_005436 [Phytophthora kernoviae]|uniref:Proteasomal ATPase-associated factor 1 n=2 Tax=Phytophthora kernoviae TaxID=325452 RepID=A0A921V7R7_9STRA|nr:hypothetical protein G195_005876 [Phytophthora kernoviae 00238/432]KAG2524346.1 hypothetical protein JM18_005436 [Phytophthora kernoviae]